METVRSRRVEAANYASFFDGRRTLRFAIDSSKPILPLAEPEISDISLGTLCSKGNCPNCYVSATKRGINFPNVVEKIKIIYGKMPAENRPYQIALGGNSEPTEHPDFIEVLRTFTELGIVPNYTTNGQHLSEDILAATKKFCGGVAVSCHPHLDWKGAAQTFLDRGIVTCLHVIVGEPGSMADFYEIYDEWIPKGVGYLVVLPFMAIGRGQALQSKLGFDPKDEWDLLFEALKAIPCNPTKSDNEGGFTSCNQVAFGALFHEYFKLHPDIPVKLGIKLYEPDVLSGYRKLDENYKVLLKSSYDQVPKVSYS